MSNLFEQLKRRNVFRAAATYLALSWVLLQVIALITPAFGLPESLMQIFTIVLLLGFIPVLIISWVYEVTPDGLKKESEIAENSPFRQQIANKMNTAVIVLLLIAIGLLALDRFYVSEQETLPQTVDVSVAPQDDTIDSIAVLPFADFSAAGDQAYLGEGIADTVLHMLAGVEGLKVAARTSSFRFREGKVDVATIGSQLGVESVLEGSVQVAGDQLRIIAQLVRTSDQTHIWSRTFDRKRADVFAIQDEIANAVVAEVAGVDQDAVTPIKSSRTTPEVYALVLQARQLVRNRNAPDIQQAIELLNRAIAEDTTYASAHSEMAAAIYFSTIYVASDFDDQRPRIQQEIDIALQLNPEDATAYAVRAALWEKMDEIGEARADYEHSLALNPSDVEIMVQLADLLDEAGEFDQSRDLYRRAYETDPLNVKVRFDYALYLMEVHKDTDQAIRIAEETVALNLNPGMAYQSLALMYIRVNRITDSTLALFEVARHDPNSARSYMMMANWFIYIDERELSEQWWNIAIELRPHFRSFPDHFFRAYHHQEEAYMAEVEQQFTANPDSVGAIGKVIQTASHLGLFDRATKLGERYFEMSAQSDQANLRADGMIAFYLTMGYRIKGLSKEADHYLQQLETLWDRRLNDPESPATKDNLSQVFISLARGDYTGAAAILDALTVGKPIAYVTVKHSAITQLVRKNQHIKRWLESYEVLITAAREEILQIDDPAFRKPGLLRGEEATP